MNVVDGYFVKREKSKPSTQLFEKACPVCGKWFDDTSRNKCKVTCGKKCSRDYRMVDPNKRFEELVWMRIKNLRNQLKVQFTQKEIGVIYEKLTSGTCEICGKKVEFRNLSIDHDHRTLKFRGVICSHCNHILGECNDDTRILQNCIAYIEKRVAS